MFVNHQEAVSHSPEHIKFKFSVSIDKHEEIVAYNDFLKYLSKANDNNDVW